MRYLAIIVALLLFVAAASADDWKPIPRRLPPEGHALTAEQRKELEDALRGMDFRMRRLRSDSNCQKFGPDIDIYEKALRFALRFDEFYKDGDFKKAQDLVEWARQRMNALDRNEHPWSTARGLVVRGYRSPIDDSPQPYGLEIPDDLPAGKAVPLYVWLHGRGDTSTDLHFIHERQTRRGQIHPAGAIVLHPFGRFCVGFKSAGEIDVLDAIESVKRRYKIDPNRIVLMGFSMGGAGAWHIGAHYAGLFAGVHAGAGFVDVARYQKLSPDHYPVWYEQKLWGLYDVPDYVRNLFNTTVVAYGGEIDPQLAGGKIMAEAFRAEGHELPLIIGPNMSHKYDPGSLADIMRRMKEAADRGRNTQPKTISVQTRTLRYPAMYGAAITGLEKHWEDSRLDVDFLDRAHVTVRTKNVTAFKLAGRGDSLNATVDGQQLFVQDRGTAGGIHPYFWKEKSDWHGLDAAPGFGPSPQELRKRHGLQGPIDDAFMGPFVVVLPTGTPASPQVGRWVDFEMHHFLDRWPALFRGDARVRNDSAVMIERDIQDSNLILWGDAKSNLLIAKILPKLPLKWGDRVAIGKQSFDATTHVPLMIYPNPLNPTRYVVLNSGPTFREDDDRTNSLQNPKLPDWAIIDVTQPPDGKSPGKVVDADFFDERWLVTPGADATSPGARPKEVGPGRTP